jgi:hypothetical protein
MPKKLLPQQYAAPLVDTPHVWNVPASTVLKLSPPPTATGAARGVVVPSPSWPKPLCPQQYAAPLMVTPQL